MTDPFFRTLVYHVPFRYCETPATPLNSAEKSIPCQLAESVNPKKCFG